jgi:bifunctional DNase/RNase
MRQASSQQIHRKALFAAVILIFVALLMVEAPPALSADESSEMVAVHIAGIQMIGPEQVLLLLADDKEDRAVPIAVGRDQGVAIYLGREGTPTPRPMTHDLMARILTTLEISVEKVTVTELKNDTFFAEIDLLSNGDRHSIDARPSDAVALAVRLEVPIFAAPELLRPIGATDQPDAAAHLDAQLGLGVQGLDPDLAEFLGATGVEGVLVSSVKAEGPAARAGLRRGDILKAIDDRSTESLERYRQAIEEVPHQPRFRIWREGKNLTLHER